MKRYKYCPIPSGLVYDDGGDWVKYSDHEAAELDRLAREIMEGSVYDQTR